MPVPNTSAYPQVLATWPVLPDGLDLSQPSPWQQIHVPPTPNPLQPCISILFNHAIDPSVYASDAALSGYAFLTSLSNPAATNIVDFSNVTYDTKSNALSFFPSAPLVAGDRYGATLRNTLRDLNGRGLQNAYYWEFEIDPSAYQGVPVPVLLTPANQTSVVQFPFGLTWGIDAGYTSIPSGTILAFSVVVTQDQGLTQLVWSGTIPASGTANGPYWQNGCIPSFSSNELATPQLYYWAVRSVLLDVNQAIVSQSAWSTPYSFYFDDGQANLIPTLGGPGGSTYPTVRQLAPLIPTQPFRIIGVSPKPGHITMDAGPQE